MSVVGYHLVNIYERFYGKDVYYIYTWTIYHLLIPIWIYFFHFDGAKTYVVLNPVNLHYAGNMMQEMFTLKSIYLSLIWAILVMSLDFFFLVMLRYHLHLEKVKLKLPFTKKIKQYNFLSYRNIALIETIVFIGSFYSIALREVMLFLSINTIQIVVMYFLIKKIPFSLGRIFFITAGYVFIIKLLLDPLIKFASLLIT